ncbi:unnamed protein product [Amoebophrya sp. A25]|nr:unnamed protein product [Amoebophrya sp. A25]|eukprot:GSA25T00023668001.1
MADLDGVWTRTGYFQDQGVASTQFNVRMRTGGPTIIVAPATAHTYELFGGLLRATIGRDMLNTAKGVDVSHSSAVSPVLRKIPGQHCLCCFADRSISAPLLSELEACGPVVSVKAQDTKTHQLGFSTDDGKQPPSPSSGPFLYHIKSTLISSTPLKKMQQLMHLIFEANRSVYDVVVRMPASCAGVAFYSCLVLLPGGLGKWLAHRFAAYFMPRLMQRTDKLCRRIRAELLGKNVSAVVLDFGAGSGAYLKYCYGRKVSRYIALEPDTLMHENIREQERRLRTKLEELSSTGILEQGSQRRSVQEKLDSSTESGSISALEDVTTSSEDTSSTFLEAGALTTPANIPIPPTTTEVDDMQNCNEEWPVVATDGRPELRKTRSAGSAGGDGVAQGGNVFVSSSDSSGGGRVRSREDDENSAASVEMRTQKIRKESEVASKVVLPTDVATGGDGVMLLLKDDTLPGPKKMMASGATSDATTTATAPVVEIVGEFLSEFRRQKGEDFSVDWIILGNVLCEVPDPQEIVRDLDALLRPGGFVYFSEHVGYLPKNSWHRWRQDIIAPWWQRVSDGCNCNRDTLEIMNSAAPSWDIQSFEFDDCGAMPWTSLFQIGLARKRPELNV